MAQRKKKDEREGGMRMDAASDKPRRPPKDLTEPTWLNPREGLPDEVTNKLLGVVPKKSIVEKAREVLPNDHGELLAAVIIAQALDRLGEKIIQAAAVSRYRGT